MSRECIKLSCNNYLEDTFIVFYVYLRDNLSCTTLATDKKFN